MPRVAHVSHPTATLSAVVRDELAEAGYLTERGDLTRAAAEAIQLPRESVSRHLRTHSLTADEQFRIATLLLGTTPSVLWAKAEERAA
jgi:plasmid maintenance system antidote protein VapI